MAESEIDKLKARIAAQNVLLTIVVSELENAKAFPTGFFERGLENALALKRDPEIDQAFADLVDDEMRHLLTVLRRDRTGRPH